MNFPKLQNRIGVHWSASVYLWGQGDWNFWAKEIKDMKLGWVKLLDDGGGTGLDPAQKFLDIGVYPIIRLYRNEPNPGHIDGRGEETQRKYATLYAKYGYQPITELNNEPDLSVEWQGGHRPDNWLDIVVDNFIIDADTSLKNGCIPIFPAFGPGTAGNPFGMLVARGRGDLGDKMCLAIHNYCGARPLEYPNDPVHQIGKELTKEEYENAGGWWAWEMPLTEVNRIRKQDMKPGQTILQDFTCFRAYEYFDDLANKAFGHSIPIFTTEGGYNVGQRFCARYAKPTPQKMGELTMRMFQFMNGEISVLGKYVPDYYYGTMPWLIANYRMGHGASQWEAQGPWYTDWFNQDFGLHGQLPIVDMLKAKTWNYTPIPETKVDYPKAVWNQSPNFEERPVDVDAIVIHAAAGEGKPLLDWLCNPDSGVSAHYLVMKDGTVYQLVRESKRAWHAGVSSFNGRENWNDFSIGIETENKNDGIDSYGEIQYNAIKTLVKDIVSRRGIKEDNIVTHKDISYPRKNDPLTFDMEKLKNDIYGEIIVPDKKIDLRLALLGVKIEKYAGSEPHWEITEALWFNEQEARGIRNIFGRLKKNGVYLEGAAFNVQNGGLFSVTTKGAVDGYWGDFPMTGGGLLGAYTSYIDGNSDRITGMGMGDIERPKMAIHTMFKITWEWVEGPAMMFEEYVKQMVQPAIIPYNPDAAFRKVAIEKDLGEAISPEIYLVWNKESWVGQVFLKGIVTSKENDWSNYIVIPRTN